MSNKQLMENKLVWLAHKIKIVLLCETTNDVTHRLFDFGSLCWLVLHADSDPRSLVDFTTSGVFSREVLQMKKSLVTVSSF